MCVWELGAFRPCAEATASVRMGSSQLSYSRESRVETPGEMSGQ